MEIDRKLVRWEKEPFLYRGTSQGSLEWNILTSLPSGRLSYHGCKDSLTGEKVTFCNPHLYDGLYFADPKRTTKKNFPPPFTSYSLVMAINSEKYPIHVSDRGEGFYIKGGISLNDIFVVYSSRINKAMYWARPEDVGKVGGWVSILEESLKKAGLVREDVLGRFEKNPKRVREDLLEYLFIAKGKHLNGDLKGGMKTVNQCIKLTKELLG